MTIPDFVIDSELFLLFSPVNNNLERIKHYFCGEYLYEDDEKTVKEAICFHEVLKKIRKYRCAISRNESIKTEYVKIVKNCDETVKKKFIKMIATRSYWNKNNEISSNNYGEVLKGTLLEGKTHYVDAARQCKDYRVIVSTGKCTKEYLKHDGELLDFDVDCKSICEFKNRLEEDNASILLGTIDKKDKEEKVFDFVIDPELFLLFSPINNNLDCIKRHSHGEILNEDDNKNVREAKHFLEILNKVEEQKCTIARNKSTKKEYAEIIKTCDPFYRRRFHSIVSTTSYWHDNNETLTNDDREILKDTILEGKTHYFDAARQCTDYRVIVSTREHTEEYCKNYEKLLEFEVNCESICEFKNSLEREILEQLLDTSSKTSEGDELDQILLILKAIAYKFDSEETLSRKLNKIFLLQPNLGGIGLDVNEIIKLYLEKKGKN